MKCQIEVTNYCNFYCHGCLRNDMKRSRGIMSSETFSNSLKLCRELDVKEVWLHNWGEPLLHPDILSLVRTASQFFKVGFTTNGSYLNSYIVGRLAEAGLNYLDISVNVSTPKDLLPHVFEMYELGNKAGIETSLRCVVFSEDEYIKVMNLVYPRVALNKIKWQRGMVKGIRTSVCSMIDKLFIIQWDGTIVPCCQVADNEIIYAHNIGDDISANWIRESISTMHKSLPEFCQTCKEVEGEMPVDYKLGGE